MTAGLLAQFLRPPWLTKLTLALAAAQIGTGTVFWRDGDPFNPDNRNACHLRAPKIPERVDDRALAFAHKRLPCGVRALIYNPRTKKAVLARKWDWGPRRGLVDVTRAVARRVGLNGKERLVLIPLDAIDHLE